MATRLDSASLAVLKFLLDDFEERKLERKDLQEHYEGPKLPQMQEAITQAGDVSTVDFDLAIDELEAAKLINTGPYQAFDNDPSSSVIIIASYSLREYACLSESGYKTARQAFKNQPKAPTPRPSVHISGGTFHQTQLGFGENTNQNMRIEISNDNEALTKLITLYEESIGQANDKTKHEIASLVEAAKTGNLPEVKPKFSILFGNAVEGVKAVAWGIITAIITSKLNM